MEIEITVQLDVDLDAFRAEYGDNSISAADARMMISADVLSGLHAASYASALIRVIVK